MALIFPDRSKCPLCDGVIAANDDIVATTAFLARDHELWRYSDAAMHRVCSLQWPSRDEFVLFEELDAVSEPLGSALDLRNPSALLDEFIWPNCSDRMRIKTFTGRGDRDVSAGDLEA